MVPPDAEAVMGQPKWTGLVHVTGDHAVIGNTVGNHLAPVSLTPMTAQQPRPPQRAVNTLEGDPGEPVGKTRRHRHQRGRIATPRS